MINLPAELGWISKNLPFGPWPSGCALGSRALGQVFTDPPSLCWQVYPKPSELALRDCNQEDLTVPSVPRKDPISRQSSSSEQTAMVVTLCATGQRKSLDCFNFTGRQPPQAVVTNIGSRDPMVKKME